MAEPKDLKQNAQELSDTIAQVEGYRAQIEEKLTVIFGPEKAKEVSFILTWGQVAPELTQQLQDLAEKTQKFIAARDRLIELQPIGSFIGDMMRIETHKDMDAAKRLADKWFPRRAIFYKTRWADLEPFFREHAREQKQDWETAQREMIVSALFLVLTTPRPENISIVGTPFRHRDKDWQKTHPSLWHWLRNEIRKEIERNLLDGETLDQRMGREKKHGAIQPLPDDDISEDDSPEVAELQRQLAKEMMATAQDDDIYSVLSPDVRLDTILAFEKAKLTENERLAILFEMADFPDEELAIEKGVSVGAVYQWRSRALKKIGNSS
jgi:hypothetical protein